MNRKLKKLLTTAVLAYILAAVIPISHVTAFAADAKLSFSDPDVMVGNEVTVDMKIESTDGGTLGKSNVMLAYDPELLQFISGSGAEGDAGAIRVTGAMDSDRQTVFAFSLKFKALKAGAAQITVTSQEVYDADSQMVTLSKVGNSTVTIAAPATSSKDADLKSLKIDPGTLTPEFSPAVLEYTASVGPDVENLVVNGVASNAGANVEVVGGALSDGENQVICRVTAEDGQTVKNYVITVTRGEVEAGAPDSSTAEAEATGLKVTLFGQEYTVASQFDVSQLPAGFEASTSKFREIEVMSGQAVDRDLTLLYLTDAAGTGGFYVYNKTNGKVAPYVTFKVGSQDIVAIPIDDGVKTPSGFVDCVITVGNAKLGGWNWKSDSSEADPEYCIFYGINWNGDKRFYRYDREEQTIQRFFQDGVSAEDYRELGSTYNRLIHDYDMQLIIIVVLIVICVILAALSVILLLKKNGGRGDRGGRKKKPFETDDFYEEDDEEEDDISYSERTRRPVRPEQEARVKPFTRAESYMRDEDVEEPAVLEAAPDVNPYVDVSDSFDDDFGQEISLEEAEQELAARLGQKAVDSEDDDDDDFKSLDLF